MATSTSNETKHSSTLLEVSDFCSIDLPCRKACHNPSSRKDKRRRHKSFQASHPNYDHSNEQEQDHRQELLFSSEYDDDTPGRNTMSVPVSISILNHASIVAAAHSNTTNKKKVKSQYQNYDDELTDIIDNDATVYTESVDLLRQLQVFDGQICKLYHTNSEGKRTLLNSCCSQVPVILKVAPPSFCLHQNAKTIEPKSDTKQRIGTKFHIYVPPTLAASLGLFSCLPRTLDQGTIYITQFKFNKNNIKTMLVRKELCTASQTFVKRNRNSMHFHERQFIQVAKKASLAEIAIPPMDIIPSFEQTVMAAVDRKRRTSQKNSNSLGSYNSSTTWTEQWEKQRQHQVQLLKDHFYVSYGKNSSNNSPISHHDEYSKKEVKRLLTNGSMISIPTAGKNIGESKTQSVSLLDSFRFYKIVEIDGTPFNSANNKNNTDECFWISTKTELSLQPRKTGRHYIQRLPQRSTLLSSVPQSLLSKINKSSTKLGESSSSQMHQSHSIRENSIPLQHLQHPSVDFVANSILLLGKQHGSGSLFSSSTLHIIGSQDNHIKSCLDGVADKVGTNLMHVDGLAAFSYHYDTSFTSNDRPTTRNNVSGSLVEKLKGIKSAFQTALKSAPCILHICNFDKELGEYDDDDVRHDEEQRFLACIKKEFTVSSKTSAHTSSMLDIVGREMDFTPPPVVLVISTSQTIPNGPISSSLTHPSISVSEPNEVYSKLLWGDDESFHDVKSQLMGRTADEIVLLSTGFQRMKSSKTLSMNTTDSKMKVLKSLIEEIRTGPVVFAQNDTSNLSSTLIPNIRWEDVGGLAHVRDEVMDAIELPLRHPQLFSGIHRSGILLFGPPGSGKTLVAKAVATECGIPFISVKGPELLGSYVGESEANIRAAFDSARKAAAATSKKEGGGGAVLFFDEIDSLAPRRGELGDGGGVMERVVATILGELDKQNQNDDSGLETKTKTTVFLIGATNRPDLLDPSLLRPGRFDRLVYLGLAKTQQDRISILASQMRKFRFENNISAVAMANEVINSIPEGLSGADFSAVASGALKIALRRLCDEADKQAYEIGNESTNDLSNGCSGNSIENTISTWSKDDLTPTITSEDLISAAHEVVPSVNNEDLKRYEALREQFCVC